MNLGRWRRTLLPLLLVCSDLLLQSQQVHIAHSKPFVKEAINALTAIDAAYKLALDRAPDSVYGPQWQSVQSSLVSVKANAFKRRDKEVLELLYAASNTIGMIHSGNKSDPALSAIVLQCSTEARLEIQPESVSKVPRDFKSGLCRAQFEALSRSIQ